MKCLKFQTAVLFALAICAFAVSSQTPSPTPDNDDQPIKVDTVLLNIPVIASDSKGRYVSGLKKENFSIIQDGAQQEIEFFADDKAPMNVAILIDCSWSTMHFLGGIKDAARDFVKVLRPEDQGMIVTFASDMRVLQEFTSDQKKLDKGIRKADLQQPGGSNMQDAIFQIVTRGFLGVKGRKAIIVLTDGYVTGTAVSDKLLLNTLATTDILVYPIVFNTEHPFVIPSLPDTVRTRDGKTLSREEAFKVITDGVTGQLRFMNTLGPATGGRRIDAKSTNFKEAFQNIADELKNQYVIGFYPKGETKGKISNIGLKVDQPDVRIRTKTNIKLNFNKPGN